MAGNPYQQLASPAQLDGAQQIADSPELWKLLMQNPPEQSGDQVAMMDPKNRLLARPADFMGGGGGGGVKAGTIRVPISDIEHGESAMPGGGLSHPGSQKLISDYAKQSGPMPAIEATTPDKSGGKWMVYDGSHRLEAAKLRGDTHIDVIPIGDLPK